MEWRADRKSNRSPRPARSGDRDGPLNCPVVSADNDLSRGIVVCYCAYLVWVDLVVSRLGGDRICPLDIEAEQGRHRALANRDRPLHRLPANFEETCRIADRDGARRGQR
jgi:hypothetical protein